MHLPDLNDYIIGSLNDDGISIRSYSDGQTYYYINTETIDTSKYVVINEHTYEMIEMDKQYYTIKKKTNN